MPSIHLPYVNIALDAFALLVNLIIFTACIKEYSNKKAGSIHFLLLQISVIVALISDMIGWFGEGHPSLSSITLVSNTVASCSCQIIIIGFMAYLSFGAFLMCVLNYSNPFYMTGPALDGTPFTVWVIAPIYIAVYALILAITEFIRYKRRGANKA
jgi:hypothetical protein